MSTTSRRELLIKLGLASAALTALQSCGSASASTGTDNAVTASVTTSLKSSGWINETNAIVKSMSFDINPSGDAQVSKINLITDGNGVAWAQASVSNLQSVFDFLYDFNIADTATVNVNINSDLALANTLTCGHPDGKRINLIGNGHTLTFNLPASNIYSPAFLVTQGESIAMIRDLYINNANATGTVHVGFSAYFGGAYLNLTNINITNFYYGVRAEAHGTAMCNIVVTSNAGDVAFHAYNGGYIECYNCKADHVVDNTSAIGFGFLAEMNSAIRAHGCTATNCRNAAFASQANGSAWYFGCSAGSSAVGFFANQGSTLIAAPNNGTNASVQGQRAYAALATYNSNIALNNANIQMNSSQDCVVATQASTIDIFGVSLNGTAPTGSSYVCKAISASNIVNAGAALTLNQNFNDASSSINSGTGFKGFALKEFDI